MRIKMLAVTAAAAAMAIAAPVFAESAGMAEKTKAGAYAEVRDDLKNAIVNRGYVVDYVGQFNGMLERTSEAVGAAKSPYTNAEFMQFCAAKLTHEAIAATPVNIVNCPYTVFAYELAAKPGEIHVGYRRPVSGGGDASDKAVANIDKLLAEIVAEVAK
ncbi:MAG: DUF302 domain-containing protein [Hyphomicrobiaceae bacterium]|nr:DUF302 domain-containing protein [Hyphomicrobiaceae bacterium]